LSLYKAVALSCVEVPFATLGVVGSISIELTPGEFPPDAEFGVAAASRQEHCKNGDV
jgi:hypothetical protein